MARILNFGLVTYAIRPLRSALPFAAPELGGSSFSGGIVTASSTICKITRSQTVIYVPARDGKGYVHPLSPHKSPAYPRM